jgi:hypothetical protein
MDYEIEHFVRRPSVNIRIHKLETFTAYEVSYVFQPTTGKVVNTGYLRIAREQYIAEPASNKACAASHKNPPSTENVLDIR